jgi:alkyldihydroxyacetonephosphate synthase
MAMHTNRGAPTPPIPFGGDPARATDHVTTTRVEVPDDVLTRLRDGCDAVLDDPTTVAESSRDWWPLVLHLALANRVVARAAVVARPTGTDQVAHVVRVCNEARIPLTAAGGRSGVCGASVPLHGGVVLDLSALAGIRDVDTTSMLADVLPGTFGDVFEDELRSRHCVTAGHWPQSMALSTVGGWLACRSAGQLSNRYGKIEDIVTGLDVVLADGTEITTGGAPRLATGPDLTQLFVGSEGTLGVITGARLRVRPVPPSTARAAYGFATLGEANDTCRRILQRGARPAVLRVYDEIEGQRSYGTGDQAVLLVYDEAQTPLLEATMRVVREEARASTPLDPELVDRWFEHRNDVSALAALVPKGYVIDTMEVSAPWRALPAVYEAATTAIRAVPHTRVASAHQSHCYPDGACLYFTFAGQPPADEVERYYAAAWDAGQRAVLAAGGSLSHHHGIGMNRGRFVREALGPAFGVLAALKTALDPNGILNPGKLGLHDPWGEVRWP